MKKRCITYLRFSSDGQSNSSIERQQVITEAWCTNNDVEILGTYKDEGYSEAAMLLRFKKEAIVEHFNAKAEKDKATIQQLCNALESAKEILILASLIDKTNTCIKEVISIESLISNLKK